MNSTKLKIWKKIDNIFSFKWFNNINNQKSNSIFIYIESFWLYLIFSCHFNKLYEWFNIINSWNHFSFHKQSKLIILERNRKYQDDEGEGKQRWHKGAIQNVQNTEMLWIQYKQTNIRRIYSYLCCFCISVWFQNNISMILLSFISFIWSTWNCKNKNQEGTNQTFWFKLPWY